MKKALKTDNKDNVATTLESLEKNEKVIILNKKNEKVSEIKVRERIPFGNKISLLDIEKESEIYKYGFNIGKTRCKIKKGELVHIHNLKSEKVDIPRVTAKEVFKMMKIEKKVKWED